MTFCGGSRRSLQLTSLLTQLEWLRAIDKAWLDEGLDDDEILARRLALFEQLRRMSRVAVARCSTAPQSSAEVRFDAFWLPG